LRTIVRIPGGIGRDRRAASRHAPIPADLGQPPNRSPIEGVTRRPVARLVGRWIEIALANRPISSRE